MAAHRLFASVTLPQGLPETLAQYKRAQERWLGLVISPNRPKYVGSWNATAMFMVGLFSNPSLAEQLLHPDVMLPPGGPIHNGLAILHKAGVLAKPPSGTELDDGGFEPGVIYANNALMEELLRGRDDWNLLDVHSGLYMLGTRLAETDGWF